MSNDNVRRIERTFLLIVGASLLALHHPIGAVIILGVLLWIGLEVLLGD